MSVLELVTRLCRCASAASGGAVLDAVIDPLDDSAWVRLSSSPCAQQAAVAPIAHGLSVIDRHDCRLQVTGWDVRALRRRLGTIIAGVDDLRDEWDATAELARYHRDRRAAASGKDPEQFDVLADVERTLREAKPLPHTATASEDVDTLLQLIEAATDAYSQLIVQHVEHAEAVLTADAAETNRHRPAAY